MLACRARAEAEARRRAAERPVVPITMGRRKGRNPAPEPNAELSSGEGDAPQVADSVPAGKHQPRQRVLFEPDDGSQDPEDAS